MLSVVLIGAGNVATHLYKALEKAKGVSVLQWYNRHLKAIEAYQNEVSITNNLSDLKTADVYIIAVSDDVIGALSSQLPCKDKLVVHTSGSVSLHDLDIKHRRGVFYPLQTFTKGADIDFTEVPICIEIDNKADLKILNKLSETLGCKHYRVHSDQRAALHLAAVFVNNFTNQLYRIGHEITESKNVDFNILKPLIKETANKITSITPYMAQTGPAKRGDKKTIKKHLQAIDNEIHKKIYELLTQSIKQTHGKKL